LVAERQRPQPQDLQRHVISGEAVDGEPLLLLRVHDLGGQVDVCIVVLIKLVTGGGVALLGAGAVFGFIAGSTNADALSNCNTQVEPTRCNTRGIELTDDARTQALLSTIFFIAGGAAIVGGGVLWLTAPVKVAPTASANSAGLSASMRF
jgi:hypothetical protein